MSDDFIERVEKSADILHEAIQDKRRGELETDLENHEVYKIEWRFSRPLDKWLSEKPDKNANSEQTEED